MFSHGIENVSSATSAINVSIHEMSLKVPSRKSTVEFVMARNTGQKATVLVAVLVVFKVTTLMGKYMFYVLKFFIHFACVRPFFTFSTFQLIFHLNFLLQKPKTTETRLLFNKIWFKGIWSFWHFLAWLDE